MFSLYYFVKHIIYTLTYLVAIVIVNRRIFHFFWPEIYVSGITNAISFLSTVFPPLKILMF